jgi:hypothetical protein
VQPVYVNPAHCPHLATVQLLPPEDVVVAAAVVVVVFVVETDVVVPPPLDALPASLTVTTLWAGMDTVTAPPDRLAEVALKLFPWFVSQADAAPGVNPLKETAADWLDVPLLVKTSTIEPSVFWKAPVMTLVIEVEVPTRTAPGRIKRDHMANAQKMPEGVGVTPSRASTRCEPD